MAEGENIIDNIRSNRIAEDLWTLVNIASPTGDEGKVLAAYAELLQAAGAEVQLGEGAVIGQLQGEGNKTLQLAGHADHIDMPHAVPNRSGDIISGRGAADMKGGISAILEIVRILAESKSKPQGNLLITVYGGHEAPEGDSEPLNRLIHRGITGSAAIVVESAEALEDVVVCGAGQSIWNVTAEWEGQVCHELKRPQAADGIWKTTTQLLEFLREYDRELRSREGSYPLLQPESVFIGQLHGGDFYNRTAPKTSMQGTRRWHPNRGFQSIQEEFRDFVEERVAPCPEMSIGIEWNFVGESYEVSPEEPIIRAYSAACQEVLGTSKISGTMVVTDAARLVRIGNVPTVVCPFDNESAHADHEFVRLPRLLESCQVALLTIENYFKSQEKKI
jgi:acetylornithine deacetylase